MIGARLAFAGQLREQISAAVPAGVAGQRVELLQDERVALLLQPVLRPEVMHHQRGGDAGLLRDRPHGRGVAGLRDQVDRGVPDPGPGRQIRL